MVVTATTTTETKTYTIDIPGLSDVFKLPIPALNNPQLKRDRIKRFRTAVSPVPEFLQWVPPVINKIDDAQDLLHTALWLGKRLIKKLPSRLIPYVGWALLASDIANISTALLSLSMTPGLTKPHIYRDAKGLKYKKKDMAERVAKFIRPGGWRRKMGDMLQAAQAADTVVGTGLQLGAIMGFVSDSIWGTYRAFTGERVEIRQPPESDLLGKATRYLLQSTQQYHARDILTPEDHELLVAANNIAIGAVLDSGISIDDERINVAMDSKFPVMIPWEESSVQALKEEGFDLSKTNYFKPYIPLENPTISEAIDSAWSAASEYETALRDEIGTGERGSIMHMAWREAGIDTINHITGWGEDDYLEFSKEQKVTLQLAEFNFSLTSPYTQKDLEELLYVAMAIAENLGRSYPNAEDWIDAADALGLKWQNKE